MSYPLFLDIEASHYGENAYPVALCWSLPDGQIKYVLVSPDDNWRPHEQPPETLDLDLLYEQGFSSIDIIRELQDDLAGQTVFVDGLDDDQQLLDCLFATSNDDPAFETARMEELFHQYDFESLLELRRDQAEHAGLALESAEENVLSLLFLARELGEID